MVASPLVLRVFLSSPSDVAEERRLAREVMEKLERGHLLRGKVRFDTVAWDDGYAAVPMDARETPQDSVTRYYRASVRLRSDARDSLESARNAFAASRVSF